MLRVAGDHDFHSHSYSSSSVTVYEQVSTLSHAGTTRATTCGRSAPGVCIRRLFSSGLHELLVSYVRVHESARVQARERTEPTLSAARRMILDQLCGAVTGTVPTERRRTIAFLNSIECLEMRITVNTHGRMGPLRRGALCQPRPHLQSRHSLLMEQHPSLMPFKSTFISQR